ncbi:MAG: glycosyltransferase family 2 protein [Rhodospirillaceae bacterium]|nr:glycosyltransferase family 2 protein [Rhodospirillaceae bacterium]
MPRFSIVIPTRSRPQYLQVAVPTALDQSFDDFEVVVQDNASDIPAQEALAHITDPRLKIMRTEHKLSMHENWEEALSHASGDYVMFIGDDDAVMPDALRTASRIIDQTGTELLSWNSSSYGWPNHASDEKRDRLTLNMCTGLTEVNCLTLLRKYLRLEASIWQLPSIYHGMVGRSVIDRVREMTGGVFFDDFLPDFFAMLMTSLAGTKVVRSLSGLSMVGWALGSHGGSQGSAEDTLRRLHVLCGEAKLPLSTLSISGTDCYPSPFTGELSCLERVRDRFFANDPTLQIDQQAFFKRMLSTVNDEAVPYDAFVRSVHSFAAREGIAKDTYVVPPRVPQQETPPFGPRTDGMGQITLIDVDGALAGLRDIGDAVQFARAVLGDGEKRGEVAQAIDMLNERLIGMQSCAMAGLRMGRTGSVS